MRTELTWPMNAIDIDKTMLMTEAKILHIHPVSSNPLKPDFAARLLIALLNHGPTEARKTVIMSVDFQ